MALPPSLDEAYDRARPRHRILYGILRAGLALAISVFIFQINLDFFESYLYDLRVRIRPAPAATGNVELIFIDPKTVEALRGQPDFGDHAVLLQRLAAAKPRAVLYNLPIRDLKGGDLARGLFIREARSIPQLRVLTDALQMKGEENNLRLPAPFQDIPVASGPLSTDAKNFAKDGVTRRFLIEYQGTQVVHVPLAAELNSAVRDVENIRGRFSFLGTEQAYINFRPPGSYPRTSFIDVERADAGGASTAKFRDKIVIVGVDTQVEERDYAMTPYSRTAVGMSSAEMHANILDTLIRNDSPRRPPRWVDFLMIAIISIITVNVVFSVKPTRGLLILGATLFVFTGLAGFAFWPFGEWIDMAHPLLAVFLCYYFFIPYRLIIENRRSWEIYQKHRLLQQVEELKTNFISMMSHDLKTPIARIQGMVDIIQRDPTPISSQQREALDMVHASSDDLLKFINSILQYGRIEAQQIELRLQSKDVNSLLKDVVKKHEFLAKLKKIRIVTELETLFPAQVDPELMKQVFSNLVENAIKYSPEETAVLVSSEEKGGRIVVQVADQGPGIPTDELSNIFMKFFRSKNAKSSPIKGSGLGLYLAKYFTELHGGRISVESSHGQGCTFTVELPLDGAAPERGRDRSLAGL